MIKLIFAILSCIFYYIITKKIIKMHDKLSLLEKAVNICDDMIYKLKDDIDSQNNYDDDTNLLSFKDGILNKEIIIMTPEKWQFDSIVKYAPVQIINNHQENKLNNMCDNWYTFGTKTCVVIGYLGIIKGWVETSDYIAGTFIEDDNKRKKSGVYKYEEVWKW